MRRTRPALTRPAVTAAALALAAGLAACTGDDGGDVPEFSGSSSGSSSSAPSSETSAPSSDPSGSDGSSTAAPADEVVQLGTSAATPDQQPVVDAWVAYWTALVASAQVPELDVDAVGVVARDGARSRIERYVSDLEQADRRLGGGTFVIDVGSVAVDGTTAVVGSCAQDQTADVDAATGELVELPGGATGLRGTLVLQDLGWIVAEVENDDTLCA